MVDIFTYDNSLPPTVFLSPPSHVHGELMCIAFQIRLGINSYLRECQS